MTGARLWGLIAVTMAAFAANSLLNRAAVGTGLIDPASFAAIRVVAGAVALSALVLLAGGQPQALPPARYLAGFCLSLYLIGFSFAYLQLDAGLGALILFGGVQVFMFSWGVIRGEVIPARRWIGTGAALLGLMVLSWPEPEGQTSIWAVIAMILAALGWAGYSLVGRGSKDPLGETAAAFLLAVPLTVAPVFLVPGTVVSGGAATGQGVLLAVLSGVVASGLGYALWYRCLPYLAASTAALVQLSAPLLAVVGGILILSEPLSPRLIIAALLILGGIAFGLVQRKIGSNGS